METQSLCCSVCKIIDDNVYKPSDKKEIDRHDSDLYWPNSIKDTIQRLSFLAIIEHTENILKPNKCIMNSFDDK